MLFILFSSLTFAAPNSIDTIEKTFPRDNTFCQVGAAKVEFSIRGLNKYTEPKDRGYGEHVFYNHAQKERVLNVSQGFSGLFRFFPGESSLCSKFSSFDLDGETFALLLQKANRPHKDKLVIQLFDSKNIKPIKVISTDYLSDKALFAPGGFYFRTNGERLDIDMGTYTKSDKKFTYQDRDFQEWMLYDKEGFRISEKVTYQQSPFKDFFNDEPDFLKATGWSAEEKKFQNKIFYLSVNHQIKEKCIIVVSARQKFNGTEAGWRCRPQ